MLKHILAFAMLCGATAAYSQIGGGYDPQCMSLCTNANYSYAYCQMHCARGSGSAISPRGGLTDALDSMSQRNLQDAQTKLLNEQTKALQRQNAQQGQPTSSQLKTALEQINTELNQVCAREEYKPLFLHTTCNPNDLTLEQLTDKSLIAAADKSLYSKFRSEVHASSVRFAAAARAYGGAKGADIALARERAESLLEKNGLALYEESINWGDYNKRRKEIVDTYRDEINKIARAQ